MTSLGVWGVGCGAGWGVGVGRGGVWWGAVGWGVVGRGGAWRGVVECGGVWWGVVAWAGCGWVWVVWWGVGVWGCGGVVPVNLVRAQPAVLLRCATRHTAAQDLLSASLGDMKRSALFILGLVAIKLRL